MNKDKHTLISSLFTIVVIVMMIVETPSAFAAIWEVTATPILSWPVSGFTVQFDTDDDIVDVDDIVSFSGWGYDNGGVFDWYDTVVVIPNLFVDGLSLIGGSTAWVFHGDHPFPADTINLGETSFAYEATSVPIPGAVWLLGSGLIGIVGIRRKLKK